MPANTIVQAIIATGVAIGCIGLFYWCQRFAKHLQNAMETLDSARNNGTTESYQKLSALIVDQHRDVETLKASVQQMELKYADLADMMQRRYARLSTRMSRDAKEGEEEDASTTAEQAELLLRDVGLEDDNGVAQPQPHQRRQRLVRRGERRHRR